MMNGKNRMNRNLSLTDEIPTDLDRVLKRLRPVREDVQARSLFDLADCRLIFLPFLILDPVDVGHIDSDDPRSFVEFVSGSPARHYHGDLPAIGRDRDLILEPSGVAITPRDLI